MNRLYSACILSGWVVLTGVNIGLAAAICRSGVI
jgi:hypothetical protein